MEFESFSAFILMAGHGFYVWLAYGVSLVGLAYLLINPLIQRRQIFMAIQRQIQLENNQQAKIKLLKAGSDTSRETR